MMQHLIFIDKNDNIIRDDEFNDIIMKLISLGFTCKTNGDFNSTSDTNSYINSCDFIVVFKNPSAYLIKNNFNNKYVIAYDMQDTEQKFSFLRYNTVDSLNDLFHVFMYNDFLQEVI